MSAGPAPRRRLDRAARVTALVAAALLPSGPVLLRADDPPAVEHQPSPCTIPDKAISLCAAISDDVEVKGARLYFRPAGEKFYLYVEMSFGGINYCGTMPAPREGKIKGIEYYLWAVDNAFQPQRTSTYQMTIQPEGACEFPPMEKDAAKAGSIKVFATNQKQGKKLPDEFDPTGVTFVPSITK